jgi:hypothetical protein
MTKDKGAISGSRGVAIEPLSGVSTEGFDPGRNYFTTTENYHVFNNMGPPVLRISGKEGRELLKIGADGSVTGEIEDAGEAARVFVESLRSQLRAMLAKPLPIDEGLVERLLEALRFYADERSWQIVAFAEPPTTMIKADRGAKARAAIEVMLGH